MSRPPFSRNNVAAKADDWRGRVRAVVFDFDGTLFDTTGAIVHAFQAALAQGGHSPVETSAIVARIGRPLYEMFPALVPGLDAAGVEASIAAYREAFGPVAVRMSRPMPGFHECMERLRAAGARLAIVTHRLSDGARAILDGFGAAEWFDALIGLELLRRPKPAPDPLWQALDWLGVDPDHAAAVGDTPDDMRAARAAGIFAVGVPTGPHPAASLRAAGARVIVSTLAELPAALAGGGG